MDPIITSVLTSFATTLATNSSKVPMQTLDDLWYMAFNKINFAADKKRIENEINLLAYKNSLANKLNTIEEDKLIEPTISIVGPALEASRYYIDEEELREMFAKLIASSLNSDKAYDTHPAYVEIIKQLTPDEAKLLQIIRENNQPTIHLKIIMGDGSYLPMLLNFTDLCDKANCSYPTKIFSYLDNLNRLGLINLHDSNQLTPDYLYDELFEHPVVLQGTKGADFLGKSRIEKSSFSVTPFGKQFYQSCIHED
ncbi:DUF4393 domain-containing protein [Sporosarcina saromensis]|uniref:DUF4393 domain-containing protein n=1 Tax=Sporosarcina saromensis TaxID=359365 RepID=A0ABU4G7M2_9BACL|nr:DUF4393 domain-containing protein [Sporosarcina saromensis]MDW0112971.1 DUF4393 domain-containing protein [Sporosarcina saromensis]